MQLPSIQDVDVSGKRVFLRSDLNVPLSPQLTIEDDTRLTQSLPTLQLLLDKGAQVMLASHLGEPDGVDAKLSLEPVARWLVKHFNDLNHQSKKDMGGFSGWEITPNLFLLENLRFHKEEENNDQDFAKRLASLADIYVNDAFGVDHRSHASLVGVPQLLPHFAGLLLIKEVQVLSGLLENPKRPLVVIIGGAKVETKLPLVSKMHAFADTVLVGGKLPLEGDVLSKMADSKLIVAQLTVDNMDISPESVGAFLPFIEKAATIIWNGPLGKINGTTEEGSKRVAIAVAQSSAYKVVGGGDTLDFLRKISLLEKFDFVSTGGGAMLSFLSGEKLPGLEALL